MPNNNPGDISPEKIDALLKMASSKLGMSQEQIKKAITNPKAADELLSKMNTKSSLKSMMSSPQALEKMINNNPKAKELLRDLMEKKKEK